MPSRLYANALLDLGASRDDWLARLTHIRTVEGPRGPGDPNQSGARSAELIEAEEQLSSDPTNAAPAPLTDFLRALCCPACGTATPKDFGDAYEGICEGFYLRGSECRAAPARLYHYRSPTFFFTEIETRLGMNDPDKADFLKELREKVERAQDDDPDPSTWEDVLKFLQDPAVWAAVPRDQVALCRKNRMFVTFDGPVPLARSSARHVISALALWKPPDPDPWLVEAAYDPRPDLVLRFPNLVLRFPTVADAGWFKHFCGVPVGSAHGLTRPHDHAITPQAEAVHVTIRLDRVIGPGDLRVVPP